MMTADPLESREELEAMSESIYWRNRRFGTVEQASDHREGVVEWFDANVRWQRVHVLTDDELAAKKAEWQAEAVQEVIDFLDAQEGDGGHSRFAARLVQWWQDSRTDRIGKGEH